MSLVVSSTKAILGTNDHGEIVFDSLSSGVKPLVFDSAESAWNTLEYVFPDKTIGYDKETDRAYEIVGKKEIRFLAGLKIIKELVYGEPKTRKGDL